MRKQEFGPRKWTVPSSNKEVNQINPANIDLIKQFSSTLWMQACDCQCSDQEDRPVCAHLTESTLPSGSHSVWSGRLHGHCPRPEAASQHLAFLCLGRTICKSTINLAWESIVCYTSLSKDHFVFGAMFLGCPQQHPWRWKKTILQPHLSGLLTVLLWCFYIFFCFCLVWARECLDLIWI